MRDFERTEQNVVFLRERIPNFAPEISGEEPKFNGPLSAKMWGTVSKLGSSYPDSFDWTVYDKLYNRFGENQPRGGVLFKSGLRLANFHDSCSKCLYAFEIDTYGRGCVHNCHYCYAKASLTQHGAWNKPFPFPIDLSEIRKLFYTVFETDKRTKWRSIMESRTPLRIGSMSDSFMWMDQKYGVTLELLKILSYYNYPYIIFTRSDLIAKEPYLSTLRQDLSAVQFSICSNNDELTKLTEPGAPNNKRRFAALKTLNEAGFRTAVRINPLFPSYPDGYFTDPDYIKGRFGSHTEVPKFNFFDIDRSGEFLDQIAESKTPTVLTGFVRLTPYTINRMRDVSGLDMRVFFRPENFNTGIRGNTDKNYSDKEISYYYRKLHTEARDRNLRFTTCYIGNGLKDFFQYQKLWSNKSDCCDVKSFVPAFQKSCQDIPWSEREKHDAKKIFAQRAQQEEAYYQKQFSKDPNNASGEEAATSGLESPVIPKSKRRELISTNLDTGLTPP